MIRITGWGIAEVAFNLSLEGPECAPPSGPASPDLNGDGAVDGFDLALLLGQWGRCPKPPAECSGDLDGNDVVSGIDLAILLGAWS